MATGLCTGTLVRPWSTWRAAPATPRTAGDRRWSFHRPHRQQGPSIKYYQPFVHQVPFRALWTGSSRDWPSMGWQIQTHRRRARARGRRSAASRRPGRLVVASLRLDCGRDHLCPPVCAAAFIRHHASQSIPRRDIALVEPSGHPDPIAGTRWDTALPIFPSSTLACDIQGA